MTGPTRSLSRSDVVCPLCHFSAQAYLFTGPAGQLSRCEHCGLVRLQAPDRASDVTTGSPRLLANDRRAAEGYVDMLERRGAPRSGVLVVASGAHPFASAAEARGFHIETRLDVNELERSGVQDRPYESAVVLFELDKAADPVAALQRIRAALAPGAVLLLATPAMEGRLDRVRRGHWGEWPPQSRYYFDLQTVQSCCLRAGFAEIEWAPDARSGLVVTARCVVPPPRPVLSIVMPVFNERATFEKTFRAVLEKECAGVDKEIVIVESRSTDGTRELVKQFETTPGVTVVFEDRPRGKGAAVRTGLQHATGTIVLIQDADDEYDVNDYDALLEPILSYRSAFVLGSRHMGTWKMRHFADQPAVSAFFNMGHVIFRTALNVMFGQKLNDPFTMYKVFRRDCLHRLKFECNRFDFDFELVIKLLRKGYVPLEVPVNYSSRSFKEGKKVSTFRDPVTWLRALVKYRFAPIYED